MSDKIFEPEISRSLRHMVKDLPDIKQSMAIECKKVTGTSLPFTRVNDHQVEALINFEDRSFFQKMIVASSVGGTKSRFNLRSGFDFLACPKGRSYIFVNFRATKKQAGKDIPKGTNRCFVIGIYEYLQARDQFLKEGRKSFPYSWFESNAIELERKRWEVDEGYEYGWDLLPIVNYTNNCYNN